jgi:hypothetical protein
MFATCFSNMTSQAMIAEFYWHSNECYCDYELWLKNKEITVYFKMSFLSGANEESKHIISPKDPF